MINLESEVLKNTSLAICILLIRHFQGLVLSNKSAEERQLVFRSQLELRNKEFIESGTIMRAKWEIELINDEERKYQFYYETLCARSSGVSYCRFALQKDKGRPIFTEIEVGLLNSGRKYSI